MSKEKEHKKELSELEKRQPERSVGATSPFRFFRHFAKEMERLFEEFESFRVPDDFEKEFTTLRKDFERGDWVPKMEVLRHNGELTVRADLPGLTKEDIKVEVTGDALTLSGERKEEKEEKHEGYYRSERSYGSFYRRVPLPEGAYIDKATATFNNGVLEITMQVPKSEPRASTLEIRGGEKDTAKARAVAAQ